MSVLSPTDERNDQIPRRDLGQFSYLEETVNGRGNLLRQTRVEHVDVLREPRKDATSRSLVEETERRSQNPEEERQVQENSRSQTPELREEVTEN